MSERLEPKEAHAGIFRDLGVGAVARFFSQPVEEIEHVVKCVSEIPDGMTAIFNVDIKRMMDTLLSMAKSIEAR